MATSDAPKASKDDQPVEISEEEERARLISCPRLALVQHAFMLTCPAASDDEKAAAKQALLDAVKETNMTPYYEHLCKEYGWAQDDALVAKMKATNDAELAKLEAVIKDADDNLGESEIREANLAKAEHLCMIGDKEGAVAAFKETYEKTVSLGHRLDIVFTQIRLGMFYLDNDLTLRNIEKAETLMDAGGDWDRRNRLKVYKGAYAASIRDFAKATSLFLDTVSTFTSYEIMEYKRFVETAVLLGMFSLPRVELHKKVVLGPEIQEMLHESPTIRGFMQSFYKCDYATFFKHLGEIDAALMKDALLAPHRRFYIREMRILAYSQLLQSYRSVTLDSMAKSFGVSPDFIDRELSHFIAAKRLNCKIDKVAGIVMTNRPDMKNAQYQTVIKQGDLLLNQVQKLSQAINI